MSWYVCFTCGYQFYDEDTDDYGHCPKCNDDELNIAQDDFDF